MGSYKAQPNNVEEVDPKKAQDAKNEQATEDVLNTALDVAEKVPAANVYAKGIKLANKLTGGAITKGASKIVNQGLKSAPMGTQVQGTINQASDSGITKSVSQATSMKGGAKTSGKIGSFGSKNSDSSKSSGSGNGSSNSSSSSSSFDISSLVGGNMKKKLKLYILLGSLPLVFLLLLIIILADPDDMNLGATNQENMTFTSNGTRACTTEEVESNLIYVGDNRVNGINNSLTNEDITYISNESANLDWFNNTGLAEIETKLTENPEGIVVISLGLNHLNNIDNYINSYRDLINKYPNQVFISSINPVDETKTSSYSNIKIEEFNKKLSDNFTSNYIDTYSTLGGLNTTDGINYDNATYQTLHSNLTSNLINSGMVYCSTGLTSIVYFNQNDFPQSYGYGTTIKSDGCGPVAMAMILSTLKGETITPIETANYSLKNGFKSSAGTTTDFFPSISNHYGINCDTVSLDQNTITNELSQSKPIIMLVGPGIFTSRNHFIILTGISDDGKISIADPLSREKSNQLWDINTIISQGTGSSLWSFSI